MQNAGKFEKGYSAVTQGGASDREINSKEVEANRRKELLSALAHDPSALNLGL